MTKKIRLLMTGSRGRIGQAVQAALSHEWHIQRYSRTVTAQSDILPLERLLASTGPLHADVLLHAAWSCLPATAPTVSSGGKESSPDLQLLRRLILRLKTDPQPPLLIFISSGSVYGSCPGRYSREEDAPAPQGAYSQGKLAAEEMLRDSGLPVCTLRVGSLYGLPSHANDAQGVVAKLVRCALSGNPFIQWGTDSVKDYLAAADFISAIQCVALQRLHGLWNLGSGNATPLTSLIQTVEDATGTILKVEQAAAPVWDAVENRLDITRFHAASGWLAQMTLQEGIAHEIALQKRNEMFPPDAVMDQALLHAK